MSARKSPTAGSSLGDSKDNGDRVSILCEDTVHSKEQTVQYLIWFKTRSTNDPAKGAETLNTETLKSIFTRN